MPPEPEPTTRPRPALPAILAAGLVGAAALPVGRTGIGWSLTAFAVAGVIVIVGRRPAPTGGDDGGGAGDRAFRAAMGLVALVLSSACAVRAAGWLTLLCLTAAAALASYALVGGAGWIGLARAVVALPLAAARSGLGAVPRSHAHLTHSSRTAWRSAAGIALGVGAVAVFGALFRAADPVYANLVDGWTAGLTAAEMLRAGLAFGLTAAVAAGAIHLAGTARQPTGPPQPVRPAIRPMARWDWIEWAAPLLMLDVLFATFVYVQLTVLFAGHPYVLGPGGPTYAEYARSGFAELLTATLLTIGVFAALARLAGRTTRFRRVLLRTLGGALGGLSLVIVASALRRMAVYAEAYGLTRARLLADATELVVGLVIVLILLAGVRLRARWLPQAVLSAAAAVLLGLVVINPDARIARTVIDRYAKDGHLDAAYLARLSSDAVTEINKLPDPVRSCILASAVANLDRPEPWYAWNAGRQAARAALRARPLDGCWNRPAV